MQTQFTVHENSQPMNRYISLHHLKSFKRYLLLPAVVVFTVQLNAQVLQYNGVLEPGQHYIAQAADGVLLTDGFHAKEGCDFLARQLTDNPFAIPYNRQQAGISIYQLQTEDNISYIHTIVPRSKKKEDQINFAGYHIVSDYNETVQYFDGLGKPIQTIGVAASPAGEDIIQHVLYDEMYREIRQCLPFTGTRGGNYLFDNEVESELQADYVNSAFEGHIPLQGNYYFSENVYEFSPSGKVVEQKPPGYDWRFGTNFDYNGRSDGHTIKNHTDYNYIPEDILRFEVSSYNLMVYASRPYYNTGDLIMTEITDENGNKVQEYKTFDGKIVLKRSFTGDQQLNTYYVYDNLDRLRYVLPPMASQEIQEIFSGSLNYDVSNEIIDKYCFWYRYDYRGRMTTKKIPGASVVYMLYDTRDRLVATQDGNMRDISLTRWLITKYDILNRPVLTAIWDDGMAKATIEYLLANTYTGNKLYEDLNTAYLEDENLQFGYTTRRAFPAVDGTEAEYTILSVTYYDEYYFNNTTYPDYSFDETVFIYPHTFLENVTGLSVAARTRVLNPASGMDAWQLAVSYYDRKGRVIQSITNNHLDGYDRLTTEYSFNGEIKRTWQTHEIATSANPLEIEQEFVYDHSGRLLETWETINGGQSVLVAANKYNELGEVVEKYTHSNGTTALQKTDYTYNVHGWLTSINDPDDLGTDNDVFAMELYYNNLDEVNSLHDMPLYNGNITALTWNNKADQLVKGYGYTYDSINRLKTATYAEKSGVSFYNNNSRYNVTGNSNGIAYDLNGNILNLTRYGQNGMIDELTYNYHGNRLIGVADGGIATGFDELLAGDASVATDENTWEYGYDANGNMDEDGNKGIGYIDYNYLNLPEEIGLNGTAIEYIYNAGGAKLRHDDGSGNITDYIGGTVYEYQEGNTPVLSYLISGEGRILMAGGTPSYEYYMKDHLGNTRVTYTDENADGMIDVNEIDQVSDYYPFGMLHEPRLAGSSNNKYLYNGKEIQEGLEWYDYGARMYDPEIGRWNAIDPLTELIFNNSPYNYVRNDPVNLVDVVGMSDDETLDEWYARKIDEWARIDAGESMSSVWGSFGGPPDKKGTKYSGNAFPESNYLSGIVVTEKKYSEKKMERIKKRKYKKLQKKVKRYPKMNVRKATKFEKWISENLYQSEIIELINIFGDFRFDYNENRNYIDYDGYSADDRRTAIEILENQLKSDDDIHITNDTDNTGKLKLLEIEVTPPQWRGHDGAGNALIYRDSIRKYRREDGSGIDSNWTILRGKTYPSNPDTIK